MPDNSPTAALTILRRKQVEARTGLSRSTIYEKMDERSARHDPQFPKSISLGGGAIGWIESEVVAWLEYRIAASRHAEPP